MQILLVSESVPLPGQAGSPRTFQLSQAIASRHTISLLLLHQEERFLNNSSDYLSPDSPFSSVTAVTVRPSAACLGLKLLNAFLLKPSFATDIKRRREHRTAVSAVRDLSSTVDVVWVDGLSMLQYAEACDTPVVLDVIDFISRLEFALARAPKSASRRLISSFRARVTRRYEARHLSDVASVALNSNVDAQLMLTELNVPASVVSNGCDTDFFAPRDMSTRLAGVPALLFVGNYAYQPNHDAALHIINDMVPRLTKIFPEATVYLVGPVPDDGFGAVPSCVQVVGFADDVRDYYAAADVFICPLRFGAGLKNKVLEAAAMECAIVASSVSVEGLALEDGVHFFLAETPDDFVERIREALAEDGGVGQALGVSARRLVEERYSWTSAGERLEALLVAAAHAQRRRKK